MSFYGGKRISWDDDHPDDPYSFEHTDPYEEDRIQRRRIRGRRRGFERPRYIKSRRRYPNTHKKIKKFRRRKARWPSW